MITEIVGTAAVHAAEPVGANKPRRIVLTRNFKGKTSAKYCALVWGQTPDEAQERGAILLQNVEVMFTPNYPELRRLQDFGCGYVLVGEEVLNLPISTTNERQVVFNKINFQYPATGEKFTSGRFLTAGDGGLTVSDERTEVGGSV